MSNGIDSYTASSGVRDPLDFLMPDSNSNSTSKQTMNTFLSETEKRQLVEDIRAVFDADGDGEDQVMGDEGDEDEEVVDVEDERRRTGVLRG